MKTFRYMSSTQYFTTHVSLLKVFPFQDVSGFRNVLEVLKFGRKP